MKCYKYLILSCLIFPFSELLAQNFSAFSDFYGSRNGDPTTNPANIYNLSQQQFSFAPLSTNFDVHLPYSFSDALSPVDNNQHFALDFQRMSLHSKKNNVFFSTAGCDWLSISGFAEFGNWNFSIKEQVIAGFGFNHSFINLINEGNINNANQLVEMEFPINELHYRTYNFSTAKKYSDKITIGLTGKLYFGKSTMSVGSRLSIFTGEGFENIDLDVSGRGEVSMPLQLSDVLQKSGANSRVFNYLMGWQNPGLGVDIGAIYQLNPSTKISASINDIGFLLWNENTTKFTANGQYSWKGLDISGKLDLGTIGAIKENSTLVSFRDTFLNGLIVPKDIEFVTLAPINIHAGISTEYSDKLELTASLQSLYVSHFLRYQISLVGNYAINNSWTLLSGLTLANKLNLNLPVGVNYQSSKIGFSISMFNLPSLFLPYSSQRFGGEITMRYIFLSKSEKEAIPKFKDYPFYQPSKKRNSEVKLF